MSTIPDEDPPAWVDDLERRIIEAPEGAGVDPYEVAPVLAALWRLGVLVEPSAS